MSAGAPPGDNPPAAWPGAPDLGAGGTGPAPGFDAWRRWATLAEVYFAVVCLVVAVSVAVDRNIDVTARTVALTSLAVLVPGYLVLARAAMRSDTPDRRAWLFLAVLFVLFVVLLATAPGTGALLYAICPLLFFLVRIRTAIILVIVASLLPLGTALVRDGVTLRVLGHAAPGAGFSVALSVWLGLWIQHVIRQSAERAALIKALDASQAEVARLSREAGVAAERSRFAGEIHDTLAQGFASVITLLEAVGPDLATVGPATRRRVDLAVRTARENLAESRALIVAAAPPPLEADSLEQAIRRQVERAVEQSAIDMTFGTYGQPRALPTAAEVVLLRTAQEALANVRRHSGAGVVTVRLEYTARTTRLAVHDDGCGFAIAAPAGGYGLLGMRTRAEQIGATLTVTSHPGSGTSICLEVPA